MNRRQFFRMATGTAVGAAFAGTCYGFFESGWVAVSESTFALPNLPPSFKGTRIAFLTDIHHGPYTDLSYIEGIVRTTNLIQPDIILHGGDYSLRDGKYIGPVFEVLAQLRAPMGIYGVLGNHDYWHGLTETKDGLRSAGVTDLTNTGEWLVRGGDRLRIGGVDDLWCGQQDAAKALGDATAQHASILLSHNPDYAENLRPDLANRVGLMLSGHTHGGQMVFPGGLAPFVPSRFGTKYLRGVVQAPNTIVLVSRGLGTSMLPARIGSRPEINVITLV
ncbi:hypothetical protein BH11PLA2_BH11PLA2_45520 [soil metagenome]